MSNEDSFRGAKQLQNAVRGLAGSDRAVLQKRIGQAAVAQAQLGVRQGRDPYGKAWAPLTSRVGQPLRRTGNNIQRSWTASGETPDSFKFGSRFKYLATHQYRAVIVPKKAKRLRFKTEATGSRFVYAQKVTIPRRQLVPEADTGGLGVKWLGAFKRVVRRFLEERLQNTGTGG